MTPLIKKTRASILVLLFLLAGCGTTTTLNSAMLKRIDDQGPVALSADNAYLVGNLALAREVETSPVLRGFIANRGVPYAIEVSHSLFTPYHVTLYYPKTREAYVLERSEDEWLIQGPIQIDREKFKDVILVTQSIEKEPKLLSGAELKAALPSEQMAAKPVTHAASSSAVYVVATPTATPKATIQLSNESLTQNSSASAAPRLPLAAMTAVSTPPSLTAQRTLILPPTPEAVPQAAASASSANVGSTDDDHIMAALAQQKSNHAAELSPKGDVVHYVTLPGENLSIIARWYTFDRSNADRIARINGLTDPNAVTIGDTVIIPAYLVKNKNRLTQSGLDWLENLARDEKNASTAVQAH